MAYEIELVEVEPMIVAFASAHCTAQELGATYARLIPKAGALVQSRGAEMAGPPFSRQRFWSEATCDVDAGIIIDRPIEPSVDVNVGALGGGVYAFTLHRGPYDRLPDAYNALQTWFQTNNRSLAGPAFELYVNDPGEVDPSEYETEIYWPVQP